MLKTREVLLAKVETTYNTDAVPTAGSNALLAENLSWSFENARMYERAPVRANIAKLKPIYAGSLMGASFDVEVKGSGTAGTAPELGAVLQACGFAETIVALTSVTYKPVSASTSHKSVTLYYYQDGMRYAITGCRGTVTFAGETGSVGKLSFKLTGHISAVADVAMVTPTYLSTVPVPLIGVPFSVDGYSAIISKLAWDIGNTVAVPPSISATDGYSSVQITARALTGSIDPEMVLKATQDFIGKWQGGNAMALASGTIGAVAGNRYSISMPAITYTGIAKGDRDGVSTVEASFMAAETSAGDDEISIVFT